MNGSFNFRRRLAGGDPPLDQQVLPRDSFGHLPRRAREHARGARPRVWSLNHGYVGWWNAGCWCFLTPPGVGDFFSFFSDFSCFFHVLTYGCVLG